MANSEKYSDLFCEWNDCGEQFDDLTLFLKHVNSHSQQALEQFEAEDIEEPENFQCSWSGCNEELSEDKSAFSLHVAYHAFHTKLMRKGSNLIDTLSEKLGCEVQCFMDNSTRNLLPQLPDSFICGWKGCFTEFIEAESYYRHVETHPFDIMIPSLSKEALRASKFARCEWQDCSRSFNSRSHLKEHLKSHTQEKTIACPHCGAMFSSVGKNCDHFLRQMDIEEKQIEAITVQVTMDDINQQYTVTLHVEPPPTDENDESTALKRSSDGCESLSRRRKIMPKIFRCEECDREFATGSLLREHSRKHYKRYKCDICGQLADSPSSLRHHILYRHTDDRPFACQFCDSKFKSRSDLRKHIDIHSEENPYRCSLCSFECRCCHTLSKHIKQEHQSITSEYLCHECKKKFTRGNNLTRHLITIHKYSLKEGQSKFCYSRQADGFYRLEQ
ncbi:hypothetical protein B4U80_01665 [Leptotrombidium deliense]|uniref:C2H2-type domain-containing protein n=1 Tax=Leptotrombidium deliense TaxID=299467 RepID=A0A443SKL7_9ACAR|nr:hypothetical protein B4U80_01665 [Leptotrombidium deliense]